MTKLETDIFKSLSSLTESFIDESVPKAAAEVAKKYIEQAWEAAGEYEYRSRFGRLPTEAPNKTQWLKENGITE